MNSRGKMYVIGIDYGTDSCRAVITDAHNGQEIASAVARYPRWAEGCYCDAANNQFRQHPQDYIDSLLAVMDELAARTGTEVLPSVQGIAIDTTGSTPCLVTAKVEPLAMLPEFADNPNAMFMLWKDHTATDEAFEINALAHGWKTDFTMYEGGVYSSEWLWAKLLHVARTAPEVMAAGVSVIEHCDWMPALLTGVRSLGEIKRSRCAMGHKAMWHESFGGYPSDEFLARLHPELVRIKKTLGTETWTSDTIFGQLSVEWARRLHLKPGLPVAVGAYDAHMGAVGGGVEQGVFIKVMGTSTCDMIVGPPPAGKEHLVRGICGQVDGSIIPGMLGYEAGQSAFGDVYAWFKNLLIWPLEQVLPKDSVPESVREETERRLMPALEKAASAIEPRASGLLALDWLNGRRTPDANQKLKGAIIGLSLGTTAPMIYRALIEATAFGARAIVERFVEEHIAIQKIRAIGGVARKSPLVMQIVADVLGKPIEIVASDQSVALGAAMFAAVVAGFYASVPEAQAAMRPTIEAVILPDPDRVGLYNRLYRDYQKLGAFIEREFT
jgi:L-ribulokinase